MPHGFRSSFRDWAAERTNTPREVVEASLAHTVQNPTEAAYARSDLFERRRRLMDDWATEAQESRTAALLHEDPLRRALYNPSYKMTTPETRGQSWQLGPGSTRPLGVTLWLSGARGTRGDRRRPVIKLELSYLTLYNGECEETRWSFA